MAAVKDASQRVVLLLGDWIELVIMATGTGNGQSQKRAAQHVQLFIDKVRHYFFAVIALD
ncbi:MAG: hypothetical protein CMJ70_17150 [Planctomycetaceae bacterium]|nr:hypothetical protein [Planctomycetaceae bacterium]HAA70533.1 hypothetical protein [Planctomycetaceae bacterium]